MDSSYLICSSLLYEPGVANVHGKGNSEKEVWLFGEKYAIIKKNA